MVSTVWNCHSPESKKDSLKRAAAVANCSTIVSDTTATPRGVNMESTPSPRDASSFSLQPPFLSRQASNTYEDAMPLMPTSCGKKKHLNEIDVEAFMRSIAASPHAIHNKKRSKPSGGGGNLKPPALQPRISSSSYSYDDLKSLTRPTAVKCYSFGSPKPFCQVLTPTPIKSNLSARHGTNQLLPPDITRTASADNIMAVPLDHEFLLEAPPALLRRASSNGRNAKRHKFSSDNNFDGLMGSKEADFWCTDLMDTFAFDLE
jgi:hypothetical protein